MIQFTATSNCHAFSDLRANDEALRTGEIDVRALNESDDAFSGNLTTVLSEYPCVEMLAAHVVARRLGIKLHATTGGPLAAGGVTFAAVIYLFDRVLDCARFRYSVFWAAGHEMWHSLEQTNNNIITNCMTAMRPLVKRGALDRRMDVERQGAPDHEISDEKACSELLADINGNMWIDEEFWRMFVKRVPLLRHDQLFGRDLPEMLKASADTVQRGARFGDEICDGKLHVARALLVELWGARYEQIRDCNH
jgi:hypothetical protein